MSNQTENVIIEAIAGTIEIPDSAYETAESRYKDIGDWIGRDESSCAPYDPHVFAQGSFRLGTVVRPLREKEEYDLDLCCKLREGISKSRNTQEQVKHLVGSEVESYRVFRGIEEGIKEKHRCWRLVYKDQMNFHMDILPCIPEEESKRQSVREAMIKRGTTEWLASTTSGLTVSITDDRHPYYKAITDRWNISNPEGYACWFETQMRLAEQLLEKRAFAEKVARIDDLPVYRWKTPLQRCVQILKRHRDVMFDSNPTAKPISVIITTLAAEAYAGEADVAGAMKNILERMGDFVLPDGKRIPNPVDPDEDFADRWTTPEGQKMKLEESFWAWLDRAKADFSVLGSSDDAEYLAEQTMKKFGATLNAGELRKKLGSSVSITVTGKGLADQTPKKPVDLRGGGRFG